MNIHINLAKDILFISMEGEIDENSAPSIRKRTDKIIDDNIQVEKVVFNLKGVSFMDSTGIGFLIGRFKKLKRYGIPMYISNPDLTADKILSLSGIYNLIPKI